LTVVNASIILDTSTLVNVLEVHWCPESSSLFNVSDIDASVDFYSKLFEVEPAKRRPGYANFAISDPPLKLVLIEDVNQTPGTINSLGSRWRAPTK